jgi:hypothetical protein
MTETPVPSPTTPPGSAPSSSLNGWLEERLKGLRAELSRGEQVLLSLEAQRQGVKDSMLRIEGAIQALQEALAAKKDLS